MRKWLIQNLLPKIVSKADHLFICTVDDVP